MDDSTKKSNKNEEKLVLLFKFDKSSKDDLNSVINMLERINYSIEKYNYLNDIKSKETMLQRFEKIFNRGLKEEYPEVFEAELKELELEKKRQRLNAIYGSAFHREK